jgi:D-alanyl-D-alanine carboxypeptidase
MSFSLFSLFASAYELDESKAKIDGYYLYDIKNNILMAEKNADLSISPSSSVKIMTACIVLESSLDLYYEIEISPKMIQNSTGRSMELKVGDKILAIDLLYAMLCGGFNDAAVALALSVSPTLYEFITLMNDKANSLGMRDTRYVNLTGIEADAAKTTVNDLFILSKYMTENQFFVDVCSTKYYKFSELATTKYSSVNNRSGLLATYKNIANFNTGSSSTGDCVIAYYSNENSELISIVINASSKEGNTNENIAETYTKNLIHHAQNAYSTVTLKSNTDVIASLPVNYSISGDVINLYLKDNVEIFMSNEIDPKTDLVYTAEIYGGELKAPINYGDEVGILKITHNGVLLASAPIISKSTVDRNSFLFAMDMMKKFVTSPAFIIIIIAIILFFAFLKSSRKRKFRKKNHKRKNKSKFIKK